MLTITTVDNMIISVNSKASIDTCDSLLACTPKDLQSMLMIAFDSFVIKVALNRDVQLELTFTISANADDILCD